MVGARPNAFTSGGSWHWYQEIPGTLKRAICFVVGGPSWSLSRLCQSLTVYNAPDGLISMADSANFNAKLEGNKFYYAIRGGAGSTGQMQVHFILYYV